MAPLSRSCCINDILSLHLLVEVLARLPLRNVFQCKSVCKLWLSCIQDSCFVTRFVEWNEGKNDDLQQKQVISFPVAPNLDEMLLIQPSCSIPVTASQVSLEFLPFFAEWVPPPKGILNYRKFVSASNNGLLVCSPKNSAQYYICNPLTRQWLALPLAPPTQRGAFGVGFICDDSRFGLNLVRLLISRYGNPTQISAELFSSKTGWSTLVLPDDIVSDLCVQCPPVSYKGKIHWLLTDRNFMIYDPEKRKLLRERVANGPPAEELYITSGTSREIVGFDSLSLCQGSFWIGQALNGYVRVFRLVNGMWVLEHNVDACNEMHVSSSSLQQKLLTGPPCYGGRMSYYGVPMLHFWSMHPSDPMIAYMSVDSLFLECNFRDRTMEVLSALSEDNSIWSNAVMLSLSPWPTPLPTL
ncbi:F-box protein At5g49610 [Linum grandiflorum]